MPDKSNKDSSDELFRNAPDHVKKLHKESKKLRREVKRKLWWDKNNPNR
jgi:predicted small metal-binding protein